MTLESTCIRVLHTVLLITVSFATLAKDTFTGTESCKGCHAESFLEWKGSHHDLAMQHATTNTVLGDFNNGEFTRRGITSRFYQKDDQFFVNTDGPDGSLQDFRISYTFGVTPLQQYLVEFPDGRLQALSIAWDTRPVDAGGQRWFHLYEDEKIDHAHALHWTRPLQNWNYMCAECHSTDLIKGYNINTDSFRTTWSDINVGCESCHGPGKDHLAWSAQDETLKAEDASMGLSIVLDDRKGVGWTMDASTGTAVRSKSSRINRETAVCATCHSRRGILKTGVESDGSFLDHYRPALLTQNLYHADGQIQEEVYVWGSFMQSKMQSAGVTCSDCHQPHSLELRAPQEQVCSRCHSPAKFANTTHHHHAPDSKGANCLDCHMPETTYMVVDPRRDHSLRVPRPDISLNFSTPNACNQCHLDKDTEWAAEKFEQMWPQVAQPFQNWTQAFALARSGAPQSEIALMRVIKDPNTPDIARATAVTELRAFLSPLSGQLLHSTLSDESALVRMASLGALEALPPANRYTFAAPLLEDPVLAVRIEAARISASSLRSETDEGQRKILQSALKEYFDAHILNADRSDANLNLGNLHVQTGDIVEAEKAYRRAIKLDSKFGPAYVNLADMYRSQGMDQYSGKVLKQGIDESPRDASLHHALGLLEARGQNLELALASLKTATQLAPENARYIYVYGVALNSTGKSGDALEALGTGHGLHPQDREIIFMIASIYRDQRQYQLAREWAQKLTDINPADQNALQLIEAIDAASRMNE